MNSYQQPSAMPTRQSKQASTQTQAMPMTREQQIQQMVLNGVITPQQAALMLQREAAPVIAPSRSPMPTRRKPLTPSVFPSIGGISSA